MKDNFYALADAHERSICPEQASVIAPFPTQVLCTDADLPRAKRALDGLAKFPDFMRIVGRKAPKTLLLTGNRHALAPMLALFAYSEFGIEHSLELASDPKVVRQLSDAIGGGFSPRRDMIYINFNFGAGHLDKVGLTFPKVPAFAKDAFPSAVLTGQEEMTTGLLVHELSHVLDLKIIRNEDAPASEALRSFIRETAISAHVSGRTVTEYANSSPTEWFAETMTAYLYWPDALKDFDSLSHLAMKSTLEELSTWNKN